MLWIKILAFVFLVPGFMTSAAARWIVTGFKLDEKVKVDFESEMTEDELKKYRFNKALVNLKLLGLLIAFPGLFLFVYAFK